MHEIPLNRIKYIWSTPYFNDKENLNLTFFRFFTFLRLINKYYYKYFIDYTSSIMLSSHTLPPKFSKFVCTCTIYLKLWFRICASDIRLEMRLPLKISPNWRQRMNFKEVHVFWNSKKLYTELHDRHCLDTYSLLSVNCGKKMFSYIVLDYWAPIYCQRHIEKEFVPMLELLGINSQNSNALIGWID